MLGAALATAAAALGVGNPPACGVLAVTVAYRLQELAQKTRDVGVCSPRLESEQCRRAGAPALMEGGGARTESRKGLLRWSSEPAGPSRRCGVVLRMRTRGQGCSGLTNSMPLWRRVDLPAAAFRGNPGEVRAMVEGGCLGELPGSEAVLLHGLAGVLAVSYTHLTLPTIA